MFEKKARKHTSKLPASLLLEYPQQGDQRTWSMTMDYDSMREVEQKRTTIDRTPWRAYTCTDAVLARALVINKSAIVREIRSRKGIIGPVRLFSLCFWNNIFILYYYLYTYTVYYLLLVYLLRMLFAKMQNAKWAFP